MTRSYIMARSRNNPAANPVTGNLFRIVITFTTDGNVQQCLFDYTNSVAGQTVRDMPLLVAAFKANFASLLEPILTNDTTITNYSIADLNPGKVPTLVIAGSGNGTVTGQYLPLLLQANIEWSSGLKGQHGRGRTQLPGVPISFTTPATDPNYLNAASIGLYANFASQRLDNITVGTGPISVYNPVITTRPKKPPVTIPPTPTPLPGFAQEITGYVVRPLLGTQRRRYPGRGI
jgi:hypothetical protein